MSLILYCFCFVIISSVIFLLWVNCALNWNYSWNIKLQFIYSFVFKRIFPKFSEYKRLMSYNMKITTMNYGYSPVPEHLKNEKEKHSKSLYDYVSYSGGFINESTKLCEISSGRGGGLNYIHRRYNPSSSVGLEFSPEHVRISKNLFGKEEESGGLSFVEGSATNLPFDDEEFEVMLSIEASHNYREISFFEESFRCLKKGGVLLVADIFVQRDPSPCKVPKDHFSSEKFVELGTEAGFALILQEDITRNVVRSSLVENLPNLMKLNMEVEKNPFVRIPMKVFSSFFVVKFEGVSYKRFVFKKLED